MSLGRARWLGTPLLVGVATLSVSISVYHVLVHQAPLLPTVLGQWSLFGLSVVLCGSVYYALGETESGAERATVGSRAGVGYTLATVASAGYALHQFLTPEAPLPADVIAFQATFMGTAGGIAGVYLGLERVRRDRTLGDLRATTRKLDQSNEQLQEFAYVAAHDLQEPARMVATYVDLLDAAYDDPDDQIAAYLTHTEDGARELLEMIDGLRNYYEATTREPSFEAVDTDAVVKGVLEALEPRLQEADVTVSVGDLPTVTADATQLEDVFEQLLENALEHGTDVEELHISASRTEEAHRFAVTDDGGDDLTGDTEKLFRIFADGGDDTSGPGVGLAVCEFVVNRHHGDIWVESDDGEGTTFYFTIPAETRPEPSVATQTDSD